jgi:hypothetical protein
MSHAWRFSRSGGFDQAVLDSAADLAALDDLDQKLWAALACPVKGLEFDERTLALLDTDKDGRVRAPEVLAAVRWCREHLRDLGTLKSGADSVQLVQIQDQTDSGKALLAAAKQVLKDLGKASATSISLADVADTSRIFAQTKFNGDGVVPADTASEAGVRSVMEQAIDCVGGVTDRSGKPGLDRAKTDLFFAQIAAFDAWAKQGEDGAVRVLGDATGAALDALRAVRAKGDDYFARCRLAEFDGRALAAVNRSEAEYAALAAKDLTRGSPEMAALPVSKVEPGKPLPLKDGLNPAWESAVHAFRAAAVAPLLGREKEALTAAEWTALCAKLAPYEAWLAAKPATSVEKLGATRVREIASGGAKGAIDTLLAEDTALQKVFEGTGQVEQLIRYHRDLYRLLHNFVNFRDFYSRERSAIFQVGTLYLDGRACELCVRVEDAGKHAALAGMSKSYLAYCDCTRPGGEKLAIAAAFTGGDSDFLMVGRNGVFYDRKGRDWDATITKIVDNPISVRQAFWAPYKKLVRLIEEQAAKRASAAEAESDAKLATAAANTANADKAAAAPKPAEPKKMDVGTVAALGVAFGAIGTLLVALVSGVTRIFNLPFWQICLAFAGILLLISGPSMFIAWLKLRQRNLGPILDANGWAINGRVKMNVPFGGSLTSVAKLPPGAVPAADPFGEKRSMWPGLIKFVVIVGFFWSLLNDFGLVYKGLAAARVADKDIPSFVRNLDAERRALAAFIAQYDKNRDSKVERAEFTGTDDQFKAADVNGDEFVTDDDLK